jgi:hypothetical protein
MSKKPQQFDIESAFQWTRQALAAMQNLGVVPSAQVAGAANAAIKQYCATRVGGQPPSSWRLVQTLGAVAGLGIRPSAEVCRECSSELEQLVATYREQQGTAQVAPGVRPH